MSARLAASVTGPGDAPVVVLGSSLGTTRAMWAPQLPALSAGRRVVAYDHRGHGDSEVPPGAYRLDELARDVLALLDGLGVETFDYTGVSLGGMVGMWLAAHAPQRVRRLALVCTTAHFPSAPPWTERAAAVRAGGTAGVAEAVVARWFTPGFAAAHPDVVAAHREMLLATPDEGYAGCCDAIGAVDLRPDLPRITAPTLVVVAEGDTATAPEHGRAIADAVPGARFAVVDDAAHLAGVEQPAEVTRLLLGHLDGLDG